MNLEFDIKRSIILAEYIKCWGVPDTRKVCDSMPTELYIFPGEDMDQVTRVVTIGLSSCKFSNDKACNNELLMVLPFDVAEDQWDSVSNYLFDISSYIVNDLGRNVQFEDIKAESANAPEGWPGAILFDEPRGEPNELKQFYIGMQHITLSWVVPIFSTECDLIRSHGIDAFDSAIESAEASLVEVRRESSL